MTNSNAVIIAAEGKALAILSINASSSWFRSGKDAFVSAVDIYYAMIIHQKNRHIKEWNIVEVLEALYDSFHIRVIDKDLAYALNRISAEKIKMTPGAIKALSVRSSCRASVDPARMEYAGKCGVITVDITYGCIWFSDQEFMREYDTNNPAEMEFLKLRRGPTLLYPNGTCIDFPIQSPLEIHWAEKIARSLKDGKKFFICQSQSKLYEFFE